MRQTWIEKHDDAQTAKFKPVDTHGTHLEHKVSEDTLINLTQPKVVRCWSLTKPQARRQREAVVYCYRSVCK